MSNNEMNLIEYIEYIKRNIDRIEEVAKNSNIDLEYTKKIIRKMNIINKNIYEIYVLIEGYFGWEDFI